MLEETIPPHAKCGGIVSLTGPFSKQTAMRAHPELRVGLRLVDGLAGQARDGAGGADLTPRVLLHGAAES